MKAAEDRSTRARINVSELARDALDELGHDRGQLSNVRQQYAKWRETGFGPFPGVASPYLLRKISEDAAELKRAEQTWRRTSESAWRAAERLRLPEGVERPTRGMDAEQLKRVKSGIDARHAHLSSLVGFGDESARKTAETLPGSAQERQRKITEIIREWELVKRWYEVIQDLEWALRAAATYTGEPST